ncbi:class I SAM-dependent methyltransferase [Nitrogeniibacter mangrovi]|uniref:Class I SAM-dependent methyltransferase n=1 Tax=Nitrogeniibacter mangrovi TaxID=2016596 RepID=A0A6C1B870_9RHOO|nr:rhodoquinone biosynthesis methyltransferase RquA [Nitrogeniibacter mangrovi]QID19139.1 class I SAM-dependent methyltransferase [Nitrogeniibacter mangrovi]
MTKATAEALDPTAADAPPSADHTIPDYLERTYRWAYLNPRTVAWLDRPAVVSAILWGNARRLMCAAVDQFEPGQRVLQAACVYGDFTRLLACRLGEQGDLLVIDAAPVQLDNLRRKLAGHQVRTRCADLAAADPGIAPGGMDGVACFFLLHEVPPAARRRIVDTLLASVRVGGKVVFTDYHRPACWHPLRPLMALVFRRLEPYAASLQAADIAALSPRAAGFDWRKTTVFGGLYQQVVAVRRR